MGQDWKTLGVVVIGAAIAGWWMVRALGSGTPTRAPGPVAAVSEPAPARTAAPVAAVATRAAIPVAPAKPIEPPPALDEDGEVALIQRDLTQLAEGLAKDQRIEDRVMPRNNDMLDVPGVVTYRRATDFWEPALADPAGAKP